MNPRSSAASPEAAAQPAGAAGVASTTASAASNAPAPVTAPPGATAATRTPASGSTPARRSAASILRRGARPKAGSSSRLSETTVNRSPSAGMPRSARRAASLRFSASVSSTPPAPAPTVTSRNRPPAAAALASTSAQRSRNRSTGLTGRACSAPSMPAGEGVDPMSSETKSKASGGRLSIRASLRSRSRPVTAPWMSLAPANAASGARSTCASAWL